MSGDFHGVYVIEFEARKRAEALHEDARRQRDFYRNAFEEALRQRTQAKQDSMMYLKQVNELRSALHDGRDFATDTDDPVLLAWADRVDKLLR